MVERTLLVLHIVVLGYWLGADLVINSTYRYVSWSRDMPFAERNRLMEHVMLVDQHVRYALVLQLALGTSLAALRGYVPYGRITIAIATIVAVAWIVLLELVHRLRHTARGELLNTIDLTAWICAGVLLLAVSAASAGNYFGLPNWLALKLALFGGVFLLGVGIRVALKGFFVAWQEVGEQGSNDPRETAIRRGYVNATGVLVLLWIAIAVITVVSIWGPVH